MIWKEIAILSIFCFILNELKNICGGKKKELFKLIAFICQDVVNWCGEGTFSASVAMKRWKKPVKSYN